MRRAALMVVISAATLGLASGSTADLPSWEPGVRAAPDKISVFAASAAGGLQMTNGFNNLGQMSVTGVVEEYFAPIAYDEEELAPVD